MSRPTPEDEVQARAAQILAEQVRQGTLQSRTQRLYHITPSRNVSGILRDGLLLAHAQGRTPAIWLCARTLVPWAIQHVRRRHGVQAVTILEVHIPRRHLAHFTRGRWFTRVDISADRVQVWTDPPGG
jgi:hypothetical protein